MRLSTPVNPWGNPDSFNQNTFMPLTEPIKHKLDTLIRFAIWVDLTILLLYFLSSQFGVSFPFPLPGKKLNNPLALLLLLFSIRLMLNVPFRKRHFGTLNKLLTDTPHRFYFFAVLIVVELALQIMWFAYPDDFRWSLDAEQGYGTHFSAIQLYILGLLVMMIALGGDTARKPVWKEKLPWYLVASVYFYIGLDDCIGIHDNISWSRSLIPESTVFHFIYEWLWLYAPVILAVVIFLSRFFLKKFRYSPGILATMFAALTFWILVILFEGLAKNIVYPMGLDWKQLLIGAEEGFEMLGATLFMLGFSQHLKNIQAGRTPKP